MNRYAGGLVHQPLSPLRREVKGAGVARAGEMDCPPVCSGLHGHP